MDSFVGQEAFVVFEGGGAKGVQHVATLKAIEENEFHVSGYAGASAGALVAALAAAGFKADEIFDPISKSHLLDDEAGTKRSALDLIGRGWPSIWVIGKLNNRPIEFFAFIITYSFFNSNYTESDREYSPLCSVFDFFYCFLARVYCPSGGEWPSGSQGHGQRAGSPDSR